jgi:xanthine dehydrogenase accessory factor
MRKLTIHGHPDIKTPRRREDIYHRIAECLAGGNHIVLATVLSLQGSGPREPGAMMLVTEESATMGTIGGGLLEAEALNQAKAVFHTGHARIFAFSMTDRQTCENGMICGGRAEILLELLDGSTPSVIRIWEQAAESRDAGRSSWLVHSIRNDDTGGMVETGIGLLQEDRLDSGTLNAPAPELENLKEQGCGSEPVILSSGGIRWFVQPVIPAMTVFIFGAGHVAKELAPLCGLVGFRTVIIDDRQEFANEERFPQASGIHVPASFTEAFEDLHIHAGSFIVVMTRGHLHDRNVLARALKTDAGYVGMIASRRKRDVIYRSLLDEGFAEEDVKRVHSPIGVDIGARTPAEIAVSIAAELIAARAGKE